MIDHKTGTREEWLVARGFWWRRHDEYDSR
jgi:hypothetical protein